MDVEDELVVVYTVVIGGNIGSNRCYLGLVV